MPSTFLALGALLTGWAVHQTYGSIRQELDAQRAAQATHMRNDVMLHALRHVDVLHTFHAEFAAHPDFSQAAFGRVAEALSLQDRLPGIEAVGQVRRTSSARFAVRYLYPRIAADEMVGSPISTEPIRWEAISRARDTGDIAATAPVGAAFDPAAHDVVMVYLPLYRGGHAPSTLEDRREQFEGAVFIAIHAQQLMETVFYRHRPLETHIRLDFEGYRAAAPAGIRPATLYDSVRTANSNEAGPQDRIRMPLEIAGTTWALDVGMARSDEGLSQRWLPWTVLIAGLLLSILSAIVVAILQRSRDKNMRLAIRNRDQRREAETALHLRHRAIEASANAIVIASATRAGYPVEYVNPAFERMTGYTAEEIVGQSLRVMHGSDNEQSGLQELQAILQQRRDGHATLRNYRKDGQLYWTQVHIAPVRDEAGAVTHFVAAKYDITEMRRYQETLEFQAWHDALTHLPNRHLLRERLKQTIHDAVPQDPPFWVAFLDLDNFKLMNDALGHTLGDQALQTIAQRLQDALHEGDIVARRGGDEFVFILFNREPPRNAEATLRRIMAAVSRPLQLESHRFFPSCSIGVAVYPDDGNEPEVLIKHADMAMYHAKSQGRNNFQFYSSALERASVERVKLEGDLRAALANNGFELHYQPQLRLSDRALTGMEALVRWRHPRRGLIPPDQFIPLAEETGLIVPLGEWILREACAQAAEWLKQGGAPLRVAVNLSARQFNDQDLPGLIQRILNKTQLPAEYLELEITESLLMDDVKSANGILHTLKALGVTLSLDDFGTGYSSLAQLKNFPLDILKIDRTFVADISADNHGAIVHTIVKLAHNLGMTAIAEGVETQDQEHFLREHGCDAIQGYHVGKPMPAEQFERWARDFHTQAGHAL